MIFLANNPAAFWCTAAHESIGQRRKFGDRRYYTHPITVASLVALGDYDNAMVSAACLHDIIEDVTPKNPHFSPEWIAREFGTDVLSLVQELTNKYTKDKYPDLNRNQRKEMEAARIATISDRAKVIKRADLYHNSTEISPDRRFWDQWCKEKAILDGMIGRWEDDPNAAWLDAFGDVWTGVNDLDAGAGVILQLSAREVDEFYSDVAKRQEQAVFTA